VTSDVTWGTLKLQANVTFTLGGNIELVAPDSPEFINGASMSFNGAGSFRNVAQGPGFTAWPIERGTCCKTAKCTQSTPNLCV